MRSFSQPFAAVTESARYFSGVGMLWATCRRGGFIRILRLTLSILHLRGNIWRSFSMRSFSQPSAACTESAPYFSEVARIGGHLSLSVVLKSLLKNCPGGRLQARPP